MKKNIYYILGLLLIFSCNQNNENPKSKEEFVEMYFSDVKKENTSLAYTTFLKEFPNNKYSEEVKLLRSSLDSIEILISTFLGNETRNYYGNKAPDNLKVNWKFYLGEGLSPAYNTQKIWKGAGWTGQPLLVKEKGELYIIQGAFDYSLRKLKAETGELIWEYKYDDILKGTGSIWVNNNAEKIEDRYIIIQGSRKGWDKNKDSLYCTSLRAVSYITGKEKWRMNSVATDSYTRDVDASALIINDTAYIPLENGLFTIFDPNYKHQKELDGMLQPTIFKQLQYYNQADIDAHGDDLVPEASPTLFDNKIYTPSGTGWLYGYNIKKMENDWEYYIGADLNGSLPLTDDSCLLVAVEKQYIEGRGGVLKLDPRKSPENSVVWFFPTENFEWLHWEGGLIGSVAINDNYITENEQHIAIFIDVAGYLYLIDHTQTEPDRLVLAPNNIDKFPTPKLLAKEKIVGTIATPIIVDDKIIAPTDKGLFLYQIIIDKEKNVSLKLLDKIKDISIDATPIVWNGKIYIASLDGYLYCLGNN